ncbi:MAG: hypothetical protein HOE90_05935 [Bacteriovoracaceae bacterium]|jgi:hypothetical protein|nr:hypothetical protein [Bacteriovoracaceae bacterium]
MRTLLPTTIIFLILIGACTKPNFEENNEVGTGSNPNTEALVGIYPHTNEFLGTPLHGEIYQKDKKNCTVCHGESLQGGESKISCANCHDGFPHSENFINTSAHGREYFESKESCQKCHKPQGEGNLSISKTCNNCHFFPHSSTWFQGKKHGKKFLEGQKGKGPKVGCLDCHAQKHSFEDEKHKDRYVTCNRCHINMPHRKGFEYSHGKEARSYAGNCTLCHKDMKEHLPHYKKDCETCVQGCRKCHGDREIQMQWKDKDDVSNYLPSGPKLEHLYLNKGSGKRVPAAIKKYKNPLHDF